MSPVRTSGAVPAVVVAPKTSPAYQVHSYPTKIPPEAITPFIEAYTAPGGTVFDPFCGSGMTGVAALLSGRSAVLSDLSPGAVHLARNHTRRVDPESVQTQLQALESHMDRLESQLYSCICPACSGPALTRHLIWSDVLPCPACSAETVLWDVAGEGGRVPRVLPCASCGHPQDRGGRMYDLSVPTQLTAKCLGECRSLQTGPIDERSTASLALASKRRRVWMPTTKIEFEREMYKRSALRLRNIRSVADFFLPRAKVGLSYLWQWVNRIDDADVRGALSLAFTNTAWHGSRMRRYNAYGGQRPLTGTLYIPHLIAEANVFEVFRHQARQVARYYGSLPADAAGTIRARRSSATSLGWLADGSVDYIFTDPPFGGNIFYADCNIVWESWLGTTTNYEHEIVVNQARTAADGGKSVGDYERLLTKAFRQMRRKLKPGGRASVVFHNSDDRVWVALLNAAEAAGFHQAEVTILDKVQRSMKGYRGRSGRELVPFYDLVITFVTSGTSVAKLNGAGEIALAAVRDHLGEADRNETPMSSQLRSLEYLYSLAVGSVVRSGAQPEGLSFRAFEEVCRSNFSDQGRYFASK
jgi:DNA modification methylase